MTYDPDKSTNEVRQGNNRKMNMRVLVISLVAVVILLALVFIVNSMLAQPTLPPA